MISYPDHSGRKAMCGRPGFLQPIHPSSSIRPAISIKWLWKKSRTGLLGFSRADERDTHMVDPKVIEAVNHFRTSLESGGIRINNLILFGSASTGRIQPGNDIDIAIISDDFSGKDIFSRARMTKDAELSTVRKYRVALDVITLTPAEYNDQNSLIFNNIRKGVPVLSPSLA
jgi:predicted nucleotidyltransferase